MKFKTESGSLYVIEDNLLTRIAEHPILDRSSLKPIDDILFQEAIDEVIQEPEVGKHFRVQLLKGYFSTSKVTEILS